MVIYHKKRRYTKRKIIIIIIESDEMPWRPLMKIKTEKQAEALEKNRDNSRTEMYLGEWRTAV